MKTTSVPSLLRVSILLLSAAFVSVNAQVPSASSLKTCWSKQAGLWRWCVPSDGTAVNGAAQPAQGYCCADASTDAKCTNGGSYTCTLNKNEMTLPLWSTYWPGVTETVCGSSTSLTATADLQTITSTPVITARAHDQTYVEACYWDISTASNGFFDDAFIWIYLDATTNVNLYVMSGTDRKNVTKVIEDDSAVPFGAPVRIPITEKAIVVMQKSGLGNVQTGSGTFSFKVVGEEYNWIEKPFIGISVAWHYITVIVIFITGVVGIWPCICCISSCCNLCIVLGIIGYCRGKKPSKKAKRKQSLKRNTRFGRQGTRAGVIVASPRGGANKAKQPATLGAGNSGRSTGLGKQNTLNDSSRGLTQKLGGSLKKKIDEEWSGLPSPQGKNASFKGNSSQKGGVQRKPTGNNASFKGKQSVADEWGGSSSPRKKR